MSSALAAWPARHVLASLSLLLLLALGGIAFAPWLPLERLPQPSGTTLVVEAHLPGIDAASIEQLLVLPIERALSALPPARNSIARASDGHASIEYRFASTGERDRALDTARALLSQIDPPLPAGMEPPTIERGDPPPRAAAVYVITADELSADVLKWVERELRRPLHELPETTAATLDGADTAEVLIQPDPRRLATLGLSFDDVIQALQRTDVAPARTGARRVATGVPASIDAIAARALRLPSGEPIALAEVAQVSIVQRAAQALHRNGERALLLRVTPRTPPQAADVARRVDAHLAWLRANGLVPREVAVHKLFDEADETQKWFRRVVKRIAAAVAVSIVVVLLFLGMRAAIVTAVAFAVWLPVCATGWWLAGMSLNVMTVAGAMFAGALLVLLMARWSAVGYAVVLAALAGAAAVWGETPPGVPMQSVAAFSVAAVLAIPVAWLMSAWTGDVGAVVAPWLRRLPRPVTLPPVLVSAMCLLLTAALIAGVRSLPAAVADPVGGSAVVRVYGEDETRVQSLAEELLATLRALPNLSPWSRAPQQDERWLLQLDEIRLLETGTSVASVGRAFDIARNGLVVGELSDADTQLPLRVQLAPGAAGVEFERLLLRGEQKDLRSLYLRDVGSAVRATAWRERIRVNGLPAVELRTQWSGAPQPVDLMRWRDGAVLPSGYGLMLELAPRHAESGAELP